MRPLLLALLALTLAFAGCTGSNGTPSTPASSTPVSSTPTSSTPVSTPASTTPVSSTPATTPTTVTPPSPTLLGPDSFTVTTTDVPPMAAKSHAFNISLHVAGAQQFSSNHVGAHYASSPQASPDAATMQACAHQSGTLPGDFVVSCNVTAAGTIYLRGHARVTENNVTHEYWGPEVAITVLNETVTVTPPTLAPIAGQASSFKLTVAGDAATATILNATYSGNSTETPTFAAYPTPCQSTSGATPGNFTIVCTFSKTGTYYLRGYAKYGDATSQALFWSDELKVIVAGVGLNPT